MKCTEEGGGRKRRGNENGREERGCGGGTLPKQHK